MTGLEGVEFIHWHGRADWFKAFEDILFDEYHFDTGAAVGTVVRDWQLDLLTPRRREGLLSAVAREIKNHDLKSLRTGKNIDIYIGETTKPYGVGELVERETSLDARRRKR
jgi:hypothetical protein